MGDLGDILLMRFEFNQSLRNATRFSKYHYNISAEYVQAFFDKNNNTNVRAAGKKLR